MNVAARLKLIKKITYNVILSAAKYLSIGMANPQKTQHWVKSKNEDECSYYVCIALVMCSSGRVVSPLAARRSPTDDI